MESLIDYGALLLHDSRTSSDANDRFLDLLEDYFAQNEEELERDVRPQFHYQGAGEFVTALEGFDELFAAVGTTLSNTETPKCFAHDDCQAVIAALDPAERPISTSSSDPKCRYVPSPPFTRND